MSKYVEIKVRAYYDASTGGVKLISKDPSLKKQPFQITLNRDSDSFKSIFALLEASNSIDEKALVRKLPTHAPYENDSNKEKLVYEYANESNHTHPNETVNKPLSNSALRIGKVSKKETLFIDLINSPHTLISGNTGTGKTQFLRAIAHETLNKPESNLIIMSSKQSHEILRIDELREQDSASSGLREIAETTMQIVDTIKKRYSQMEDAGVPHAIDLSLPPITVLIDGVEPLVTPGVSDDFIDGMLKDKISKSLPEIARLGRAANIFLFVSAQRFPHDFLSGEMKANLGRRIAFGPGTERSDAMALGTAPKYNNSLRSAPGRGIIRVYASEPILFQSFIVE